MRAKNATQTNDLGAFFIYMLSLHDRSIRDAFYEFISHQSEPKVQAAVRLMGRLAQREDKNLKRFHAILANPLMRKDVFWF